MEDASAPAGARFCWLAPFVLMAFSALPVAAQVTVSPSQLSFGSVYLGDSAGQSVTLTNTGAVPVSFNFGLGTAVTNNGDFTGQTNCPGNSAASLALAPGASCSYQVTFSPSLVAAETLMLSVSVYTGSGALSTLIQQLNVNLSGSGILVSTVVTSSPPSLSFGYVLDGQTSATQSIQIANSGSVGVNLSNLAFNGSFASPSGLANCGSASGSFVLLGAHKSCSVGVSFTPQATGPQTGSLTIGIYGTSSLKLIGQIQAGLSGAGHPISVPGRLDFGYVEIGASSKAPVAIVNAGPVPVDVSAVTLTGSSFTQTNSCGGLLAAGAQCVVTVTYSPTEKETNSGAVRITDGDPLSPQTIALSGIGSHHEISVSPANARGLKNSSMQFTAYHDDDPIDEPVKWTSSDPSVATINATTGKASLLDTGTTTITAARDGQRGSTVLAVTVAASPIFSAQPMDTNVSSVIDAGSGVKVRLLDLFGDPLKGQNVTVAIGNNGAQNTPPGIAGMLTGTLTQATNASGIATFPDLKIDWYGPGYTLIASATPSSGAVSAISGSFSEVRVGDPCLGPNPACSSACADTDGDGLNDAWEMAGGVDLNGDGVITDAKHDLLLPGANPAKPDIFVWYDWMDYGLGGYSCGVNTDCGLALGSGHLGETCSITQGQCLYVCSADSDCTSRWPTDAHAGERCINHACQHTHDPLVLEPNTFQAVVARFAAHGISLHILRGNPQPHSHVVSLRSDTELSLSCEGASLPAGTAGRGKYAVSLYDLKGGFVSGIAYHYALFAHLVGCDSPAHCPANPGNSSNCENPRLAFGQAGLAEFSGDDLIVSLGGVVNDNAISPHFQVPGTFMHELGHNLGLRHDGHLDRACSGGVSCPTGDICADLGDGGGLACHETVNGSLGAEEPNYKPNYLSIMNYAYEGNGIQIGASVGSRTPLACNTDSDCGGNGAMCVVISPTGSHCSISGRVCATSSDCTAPGDSCVSVPVAANTCSTTGYVCTTNSDCTSGDSCVPPLGPGHCGRLDYSRQTLPTGGATPGALNEANLDDTVGLGSGTSDLFSYTDALCHICPRTAPTTGPVNWSGTGLHENFFTCQFTRTGVESFTDTGVKADIDTGPGVCDVAPQDVLHGHTDWPDLSGISFNYKFQCTPAGKK